MPTTGTDATPTVSPTAVPVVEVRFPIMELVYNGEVVEHREITDFDAMLSGSSQPFLLDFWAEWCGPCRASAPFVEQLAVEYAGRARIVKIDVDAAGDISKSYGVSGIPTFIVVKSGAVVDKQIGYAASVEDRIRALLDGAIG